MNCPVEATDYESSLIQADWYEEHGYQEYADAIRYHVVGIYCLRYFPRYGTGRYSYCSKSGRSRRVLVSICRTRDRARTRSTCSKGEIFNRSK